MLVRQGSRICCRETPASVASKASRTDWTRDGWKAVWVVRRTRCALEPMRVASEKLGCPSRLTARASSCKTETLRSRRSTGTFSEVTNAGGRPRAMRRAFTAATRPTARSSRGASTGAAVPRRREALVGAGLRLRQGQDRETMSCGWYRRPADARSPVVTQDTSCASSTMEGGRLIGRPRQWRWKRTCW